LAKRKLATGNFNGLESSVGFSGTKGTTYLEDIGSNVVSI
jgi:hypothetical protein